MLNYPTKEELLQKGFEVVGNVGGYEWMARKTEHEEVLYHVLKDGVSLYQFPQSLSVNQIKGTQLISEKFSIKM